MKTLAIAIVSFIVGVAATYYFAVINPEVRDIERFCNSLKIGQVVPTQLAALQSYPGLHPGLGDEALGTEVRGASVFGKKLMDVRWSGLLGCNYRCGPDGILLEIEMWVGEDLYTER